eukprot:scaffold318439_cov50-Prasinocladus_malaysianus.AAC.1
MSRAIRLPWVAKEQEDRIQAGCSGPGRISVVLELLQLLECPVLVQLLEDGAPDGSQLVHPLLHPHLREPLHLRPVLPLLGPVGGPVVADDVLQLAQKLAVRVAGGYALLAVADERR